MFREYETILKETSRIYFSYKIYEFEKVINVYSVTFSCIYDHEKEKRLRSVFVSFLHKLESKLKLFS
jgi:hypothetical protein